MYRGTTTELIYEFDEDVDLANMSEIWITIELLMTKKTYKLSDGDITVDNANHKLKLYLDQTETLRYSAGTAKTQVRFLTANGSALCSEIAEVDVYKILQGGVIA